MENRSSGPLEIVEQQNAIIRIQTSVIDELFLLIMQHISANEVENLPCIARINQAAEIRMKIGMD